MSLGDAEAQELVRRLRIRAGELGFPLFGVTAAAHPETLPYFHRWLELSCHGEMTYMERRRDAYSHPEHVQQGVRSIIVLGATYNPPVPVAAGQPRIAAYARGNSDYHNVLRSKAQELSATIHEAAPTARTRIAVDTAPLLERDFARSAGLGWFGKNTMLINKRLGSCFFLVAVLTDLALPVDEPHHASHCGSCTACIEACPTGAIVAPYELDARKCISYLNIELRNVSVPEEQREALGEWVFGCDICQEVCPWNRKAPAASVPELAAAESLADHPVTDWFSLPENDFRRFVAGTPLERQGRDGLLRNAAIVLGNLGDQRAVPTLRLAAETEGTLVAEAARWALHCLESEESPMTEPA
ncbi:MAG: tRNA epoxyqueuosine(34) reductase QueG [Planctomycetaceae bacterium]|nr:tRNA epoxyqueuosine(34) reductase QueG [Planctomycetaceae bacterium]